MWLALGEGRVEEAIAHLSRARATGRPIASPFYFRASEHLARAYQQRDELERAIEVLEDAKAQRGRVAHEFYSFYLKALAQLPRLYRQAGRNLEARQAEDELRHLLSYADEDHFVLEMLEAQA